VYEGTTLRLAPNNEKGATITFNTDVAQGSITSPQLFNIVINALLRMLTVTGQNEYLSHGLQIGNDQKGDNKRDENIYKFHDIGFIDNISIRACKSCYTLYRNSRPGVECKSMNRQRIC